MKKEKKHQRSKFFYSLFRGFGRLWVGVPVRVVVVGILKRLNLSLALIHLGCLTGVKQVKCGKQGCRGCLFFFSPRNLLVLQRAGEKFGWYPPIQLGLTESSAQQINSSKGGEGKNKNDLNERKQREEG